jgi:ATP-dependent Zn protease
MKNSWLSPSAIVWYSGLLSLTPRVVAAAEGQSKETWETLLTSWFPILLLIAVWIYFMRQRGGKWQSGSNEETNRHLERIGQSLDRIANALEKKSK